MAEASDKSKKAKGTKMDWATFVSAGTNSTSKWGDSIDDDAPESNDRSSSGGDSYSRSERSSGGDSYSRSERSSGGDSYSRGERGDSYSRSDRGGDSYSRGERGGDSYGRSDRGGDSYGRGERGDSYGRSDRGGDSYSRGERGGDSEDRGPRPQKPLPDAPPYTAFLGNLVFSVTEDDVFEFFSANCQVKSVRLITDPGSGQKKGYGYIEFEDKDSLKLALSAEGADFQGRRLRVDVSDNKPERRTPFSGESRADQAETWERGKQLPASERRALPEREERRGGAGGSGRRYGETFNRRSESDAPPASERRRLVLQPRSGDSPAESAAADAKPKHNPFGGAKPRDELYFQQKKEEERKQREEEERKKREAAAAEAGESADAAAPAAESTDAADKPAASGDDQAAPKTERKGRGFESRRGSDRGGDRGDRGDRGGDRGDRGSRGRGGFRGDRDRDSDDFQRTGSSRRGFPDRRGGDDRRGDDRRPARGGAKDEGRRETRERKVAPPKETPITNAYAALADAE